MALRFPVTRLHFAFGLLILARALADGFVNEGSPSTLHATNQLRRDGVPTVSDDTRLEAFSVSLAVKDIGTSREFYEQLGFRQVMGDERQDWLIMRNGETTVGLFHVPVDQDVDSPTRP